jgi:AcrR family transcriptional regulator
MSPIGDFLEDVMGNREETTERILEAGLALLADEGFAALGVNTLARRAGADKQLIYRYFGGLDGVLAALGQRVAERMAAALDQAVVPAATYAGVTEGLLLALLDHLRRDPQYGQLRLMEVVAPSTATAAFRAARGQAMAAYVNGRASGMVRPAGRDVAAINAALIAAVEGMVLLGPAGLDDAGGERQRAAVQALVGAVYAV